MITKIKSITNLAVFKDFDWDTVIRDDGNNVVLFKTINIFCGRNYSGKTTSDTKAKILFRIKKSKKWEHQNLILQII